ncbi:unnamed protein product, partial [Allacma fusca]
TRKEQPTVLSIVRTSSDIVNIETQNSQDQK